MDLSLFGDMTFWQKYYLIGVIVGMALFVHLVGVITDEVKAGFKDFVADCKTNIWYNVTKGKMILAGEYHHEKTR